MDYTQSEYLVRVFDYGVLHLELNTALFILVLFVIVTFVLNRLLFRPVLRTLDGRTALLNGVREDNARKQEEIARLTREYETRLDEIRTDVDRFRQEARQAAARQAETILGAARQSAEQRLRQALDELDREVERARAEALRGASALGERISQRIWER